MTTNPDPGIFRPGLMRGRCDAADGGIGSEIHQYDLVAQLLGTMARRVQPRDGAIQRREAGLRLEAGFGSEAFPSGSHHRCVAGALSSPCRRVGKICVEIVENGLLESRGAGIDSAPEIPCRSQRQLPQPRKDWPRRSARRSLFARAKRASSSQRKPGSPIRRAAASDKLRHRRIGEKQHCRVSIRALKSSTRQDQRVKDAPHRAPTAARLRDAENKVLPTVDRARRLPDEFIRPVVSQGYDRPGRQRQFWWRDMSALKIASNAMAASAYIR